MLFSRRIIPRILTEESSSDLLSQSLSITPKGVYKITLSPATIQESSMILDFLLHFFHYWIGPQGGSLKDARFVPPNVADMIEAMSDLEKFLNNEDGLDPFIKIALAHYQFETIHPFLDGNGRIGRLLITLFLMERKVLSYETLYISYFLKKNRVEYYDRLPK